MVGFGAAVGKAFYRKDVAHQIFDNYLSSYILGSRFDLHPNSVLLHWLVKYVEYRSRDSYIWQIQYASSLSTTRKSPLLTTHL